MKQEESMEYCTECYPLGSATKLGIENQQEMEMFAMWNK